ncbi:MAG: flagellar hook-basal body complex protein [Sphaerospermopsis sp. SIO1G2]|nr:flagellar hook-basal body complex protein [Sphaerospermopsis sp. SIO1G2]
MDNSVYIALSKQVAAFRHMNVVANNIANTNTTGFQAERMLFNDYMVEDGNRNDMSFAQDIATYHDQSPGPMRVTGNPLDMAISGDGYFTLQRPGGGQAYSRSGNFQLDGEGFIVNAEGLPLLDDGGQPIQLDPEETDIMVGDNGMMLVGGQERAIIGMVEFANPQNLEQLGGAVLISNGEQAFPAQNSRMLHGVLEDSNVSGIHEVVRMTRLSRGVGNTAKFIEVMYDLQRRASNVYTKEG